jgi:hypothetical protein
MSRSVQMVIIIRFRLLVSLMVVSLMVVSLVVVSLVVRVKMRRRIERKDMMRMIKLMRKYVGIECPATCVRKDTDQ